MSLTQVELSYYSKDLIYTLIVTVLYIFHPSRTIVGCQQNLLKNYITSLTTSGIRYYNSFSRVITIGLTLGIEPLTKALYTSFFSLYQNLRPSKLNYNMDIVVTQLYTRFYYTQFLIYRLYIYKALYIPKLITIDDYNKYVFTINTTYLQLLSFTPFKNKKYFILYLFSQTQNFIVIIFVLQIYYISNYLGDIY